MQRELVLDREGYARRDTIRNRIGAAAARLDEIHSPRAGFAQTVLDNFDDLGIDWTEPRDPGRINAIVPSLYGAFQYATFMTTGRFYTDAEIKKPEDCWTALRSILSNQEASKIFQEQSRQLPVSYEPNRVAPLAYTARHILGTRPVSMVDLGAGPGHTLPFMNVGDLTIACGISVDILSREKAVLLAKANGDDAGREQLDRFLEGFDDRRFPSIVADLTDTQDSYDAITSELAKHNGKQADAVLSSFVRHQLGADNATQSEFLRLVTMLLHEGGIWIDLGEEAIKSDTDSFTYKMNVYQKQDERMQYLGAPFVIMDTFVQETDLDFFRNTPKQA